MGWGEATFRRAWASVAPTMPAPICMSFFSFVLSELQGRGTDYEDMHVLVVGGAVDCHRHVVDAIAKAVGSAKG